MCAWEKARANTSATSDGKVDKLQQLLNDFTPDDV